MTKQIAIAPLTGELLPPVPVQLKKLVIAIDKMNAAADKAGNQIVAYYGTQWNVGKVLAEIKKGARPAGKMAKNEKRPLFESLLKTMKPQLAEHGFTATSVKSADRYIHLTGSHETVTAFMAQFSDDKIDDNGRFPGIRDLGTAEAQGNLTTVVEKRTARAAQVLTDENNMRAPIEAAVQKTLAYQQAANEAAKKALIDAEINKARIVVQADEIAKQAKAAGVVLPSQKRPVTAVPTFKQVSDLLHALKDADQRAILVHIQEELTLILSAKRPIDAPLDLPAPTPPKRTPRKRKAKAASAEAA